MSASKLIAKANQGRLSSLELQQVVKKLTAGKEDPYEALLVIGRADAKQHRGLVERYLDCSEDPMLARLALQILCGYWGLAAEYQQVLEQFIRKVDWDEEDDVRLMAISCAGYFLTHNKSLRLLSLLLQIFQDDNERQIVRGAAYCSLALAAGKQLEELPPAGQHFDLEHGIDRTVIAFAEEAISTKGH